VFGFINLNKPRNLGSRTAINSIVKLVRPQKVGHAGTLDPLASGVLVTAIGPATRLIRFVQDAEKVYQGSFRLGVTSDTEDITGELQEIASAPIIARTELEAVLPSFVGAIEQTPPQFSALKVDGVRAYKLARKGVEANLKSRRVHIHSLELSGFDYPDFELTIRCGGGTYIRTLGRDIARTLGSDAVMTELRRTAVGTFSLKHAVSPQDMTADSIYKHLRAPQDAIPQIPSVTIDDQVRKQFLNAIPWQPNQDLGSNQLLAIDRTDRLMAVLQLQPDGTYTPKLNFAHFWQDHESKSESPTA
jgi:tRNA pseudouridine55 synthase